MCVLQYKCELTALFVYIYIVSEREIERVKESYEVLVTTFARLLTATQMLLVMILTTSMSKSHTCPYTEYSLRGVDTKVYVILWDPRAKCVSICTLHRNRVRQQNIIQTEMNIG